MYIYIFRSFFGSNAVRPLNQGHSHSCCLVGIAFPRLRRAQTWECLHIRLRHLQPQSTIFTLGVGMLRRMRAGTRTDTSPRGSAYPVLSSRVGPSACDTNPFPDSLSNSHGPLQRCVLMQRRPRECEAAYCTILYGRKSRGAPCKLPRGTIGRLAKRPIARILYLCSVVVKCYLFT